MSMNERIAIVYVVGVAVSWCGFAIYGRRVWQVRPGRLILYALGLALAWPALLFAFGQAEVFGHNDQYRKPK